jgi:hypothetical protein
MVNHYATLLLNLPGENTPNGISSYFINHDYYPINLPIDLQQFYNLLFPVGTSNYQKQFLCYNYLRLLASTDLKDALYSSDKRVSYDLDSLTEYFRIQQIATPTSSNFNFNLNVQGTYTPLEQNNYYYGSFTISQLGYTPTIVIRSDIDKVYINGGLISDDIPPGIGITLDYGNSSQTSQIIPVGNTGLSFNILGPLSSFTSTPNKSWNFIAESPFVFDFPRFFSNLGYMNNTVDYMLNYPTDNQDKTNENIWRSHFNSVYRFTGLLNAYIDRVNTIYAQ